MRGPTLFYTFLLETLMVKSFFYIFNFEHIFGSASKLMESVEDLARLVEDLVRSVAVLGCQKEWTFETNLAAARTQEWHPFTGVKSSRPLNQNSGTPPLKICHIFWSPTSKTHCLQVYSHLWCRGSPKVKPLAWSWWVVQSPICWLYHCSFFAGLNRNMIYVTVVLLI